MFSSIEQFENELIDRGLLVKKIEQLNKELQETKAQLEKYEENSIFLGFLEECGVDNWDGYSEAWKLTKQYFKEKQRSEK